MMQTKEEYIKEIRRIAHQNIKSEKRSFRYFDPTSANLTKSERIKFARLIAGAM